MCYTKINATIIARKNISTNQVCQTCDAENIFRGH